MTKCIGRSAADFMPVLLLFASCIALAQQDAPGTGQPAENASNPLAKTKNTDLRAQYLELRDGSDLYDYSIDGAFMASDKLKIKYELHYWDTDLSGRSEQDFESFHLKGIYFPREGKFGNTPYRMAVGLEWIKDFDNRDKGIGGGSDFISPFVGIALKVRENLMLVPLVQHYSEYSGEELNQTAARVIGIWTLPDRYWTKLDAKLPYDWDEETVPASFEIQFGRMISPGFGLYVEGLAGVGDDRLFDWGAGVGLRFVY